MVGDVGHGLLQSSGSRDLDTVAVIIPALNEEASIGAVLRELPQGPTVIVVDNGSVDRTADVARAHGAIVVHEPRRGYGRACLAGMAELARRQSRQAAAPKTVVFLDADYSDDPALLPTLCRPIWDGKDDFVLGSRVLGKRERGALPPQSYWGNKLACFLMRLLFGVRYSDLGPYRAIRYSSLCRLQMQDTNFGWTVEMQVKAAQSRLAIEEIPVPYRRRIGKSKISGTWWGSVRAGAKILYSIGKLALEEPNREGSVAGTNSKNAEESKFHAC